MSDSRTDNEVFEQVALGHLDVVYRVAVAVCGGRQEAEDLVQTTFLKALERFGSFKPGTNCKAWLLQILRNTWIDTLRHRKTAGTTVSVENIQVEDQSDPEEPIWFDAGEVLERFSDEEIIKAMADLPDQQRLTLFLVDVEQLSHEEASRIMGVAEGTIKSRTSRARATLKSKLMDHAIDIGVIKRKS